MPYITPYDEKWENHILNDGRIWILWRRFFDYLMSIGLCIKTYSYVATRGGEIREPRYVISPEIKDYLVSRYSSLIDFTKEEEIPLKVFTVLTRNWHLFLPSYQDPNDSREKLYESLTDCSLNEETIAKIINGMVSMKITSEYRGLLSEDKPFEILDESRYPIYLKENLIKPAIDKLIGIKAKVTKCELPAFFREAEEKIKSAGILLNSKQYAGSLEDIQTAVELTVKGILEFLDIEFPKEHDVSDKLPEAYRKLEALGTLSDFEKEELRKCFARITILSRFLSKTRNEFRYPVRGLDVSPSEIFDYPLSGIVGELLNEFEVLYSQIKSILERLL
jgi:HEPN domain-containing protein